MGCGYRSDSSAAAAAVAPVNSSPAIGMKIDATRGVYLIFLLLLGLLRTDVDVERRTQNAEVGVDVDVLSGI